MLHKVHLAPAARYSEDIDLVVVGTRDEAHVKRAIMRVLRPLFGKEKSSAWAVMRLAVRNAAKPSRILRCIFRVPSVATPGMQLTIEVEVNVSERIPKYPLQTLPFTVLYRGQGLSTNLISYNIDEMLGTKMRALFQRKKGRDLFDLYWALTSQSVMPVSVQGIVDAFAHYMSDEDTRVPRSEFQAHLQSCLSDKLGFCVDMHPLLRRGITYDPAQAGWFLEQTVLSQLPP